MPRVSTRDRIAALLQRGRPLSASEIARRLKLTRGVATRHLSALLKEGLVLQEGEGRRVRFLPSALTGWTPPPPSGPPAPPPPDASAPSPWFVRRYTLAGISADRVWEEMLGLHPARFELPAQAAEIFRYTFTEILNNAIEHSDGTEVEVGFEPARDGALAFEVIDNGIGLFRSLRDRFGLESVEDAADKLARGSLSELPSGTGSGILVAARASRHFEIESAGSRWMVDNLTGQAAVASAPGRQGTRVRFEGELHPRRKLTDLVAEHRRHTSAHRTRVVVTLGTRFISRAEAQRLLGRLERFNTVVLDFKDVREIGEGFADEVFRVWPHGHPDVTLEPINMSPVISFMVDQARRPR